MRLSGTISPSPRNAYSPEISAEPLGRIASCHSFGSPDLVWIDAHPFRSPTTKLIAIASAKARGGADFFIFLLPNV